MTPLHPRNLTIAIATYNGSAFVRAAVGSALATGATVLVSDDASGDRTPDILGEFASRAEILIRPATVGIGAQYQSLLDRCRTPLLMLLNQDDVVHPATLGRATVRDDEVTIFNGWVIDSAGRRRRPIYLRPPYHAATRCVYAALVHENFVRSPSQVIFPAGAARSAGGFLLDGAEGQGAEDWMCWLRLAAGGTRFRLRMRPAMAYRVHGGNYSHHRASLVASRAAVRRALPPPPARPRRLTVRW